MKLMTMSVTKSSSECPELKKRESMSADSRDSFSFSSLVFSLTMFLANSCTSLAAIRNRFSEPMLSALFTFHTNGNSWRNRLMIISDASSYATANLLRSTDGVR
ncbi:hypothetical protein VIGAN_04306400 [Vigna angularis var. angularis]|uniref:Uncharacterized protein n=1 Tax=Vigna angularis var. angularis TaxID=157739 RepID=A0A0S3RY50_PHAAN|nr:hypothetical protein VIGAN_04306400 [Vigna angularis var. angularis]